MLAKMFFEKRRTTFKGVTKVLKQTYEQKKIIKEKKR
jgi:hypothetical protein